MTREEYQAQKVARERMRQMEQKHKQAARGSMDLPFLILTVLLTVVGLIMLPGPITTPGTAPTTSSGRRCSPQWAWRPCS